MVQYKPMGISKKDYQEIQDVKAEDNFKFETNQKIQNLQFSLDKLNDSLNHSFARQGALEVSCSCQINEVMTATMTSLKEFRQSLGDFQTKFDTQERWFKQIKDLIDSKTDHSFFQDKINDIFSNIRYLQKDIDSIRKEFNGLVERLKVEFNEKIKSQKEEILAIPSELPNLRKLVDQKIELVELNGQNAVLRSSNNEKQILLVERKIENLYQLVKKLEIANQESL